MFKFIIDSKKVRKTFTIVVQIKEYSEKAVEDKQSIYIEDIMISTQLCWEVIIPNDKLTCRDDHMHAISIHDPFMDHITI